MSAATLLQELKSMRTDLTGQIAKLSDDLKGFQRNISERLLKIESVISIFDEIDGLLTKQQDLATDVESIEESLSFVNTGTDEMNNLRKSHEELNIKLEHLERYPRDLNIRILGDNEEVGEDCMHGDNFGAYHASLLRRRNS